jgi:hypothetical protein
VLSDAEAGLLKALVAIVPSIGKFLVDLVTGEPDAVVRVPDILPKRSASQAAAEKLRSE